MIKLEHVVLPSPEQMEFVIEGMRNPMNSWDKSDSFLCKGEYCTCDPRCGANIDVSCPYGEYDPDNIRDVFAIGKNDLSLMQKLSGNGPVHSKYMRMMPVMLRITAPLYWWKEFDTYKVGTVRNSCSTMHKIQEKEFTLEDFSYEHLLNESSNIFGDSIYARNEIGGIISTLNAARKKYLECEKALRSNSLYGLNPEEQLNNIKEKQKQYWWQLIQLLPSSYNQTANVMLNYEVLKNIYIWRKDHKLDEWREFCKWIETLPYSELITQ